MKRILLTILMVNILVCFMPQKTVFAADKEMNIHAMYLESNDKGESVLIESKGEYLLMDLGSYGNLDAIIRYLKSLGIDRLNLYLSHLHLDHYGGGSSSNTNVVTTGLDKLTKSGIEIQTLYLPDPSLAAESIYYPEKYHKISSFMQNKNIVYLKTGDQFTVGDANVDIIGPVNTNQFHPNDYEDKQPSGDGGEEIIKYTYYENNCSLIAKITCGSVSYLSTADILEDEATELVKKKKSLLKSDILKLSHHGTGSGSTDEFMAAVQPSYIFAQNTGLTGKSSTTKKWLTNISRKRSTETGMCYLVANQKKNLIYKIKNNKIRLYENQIDNTHMLKGWIRLTGGDGEFRSIDRYYFDSNGQPLTGVQKIDGHYFYFGKGGCMQYGNFTEKGVYQGWKTDDNVKRYFTFSPDKEYAYMAYGFTKIGKQTFYFDKNGNKIDGATRTILKKIGKYKYGIGKSGAIVINNWATIGKDKYYFDKNGRMITSQIKKIKGVSYYFGKDGKMLRSTGNEKLKITVKGILYQVGISGALKKL